MIASIERTVERKNTEFTEHTHKMHDQLAFLFVFHNCVIILWWVEQKRKIVCSSAGLPLSLYLSIFRYIPNIYRNKNGKFSFLITVLFSMSYCWFDLIYLIWTTILEKNMNVANKWAIVYTQFYSKTFEGKTRKQIYLVPSNGQL